MTTNTGGNNIGRPKVETLAEDNQELYYNFEFKKAFVKYQEYAKETKRVVMTFFRKTKALEEKLGKDLYDFSIDNLEELLIELKLASVKSAQDRISTMERYMDYAISKKVTRYRINTASAFDSREVLNDLLDKDIEENMIVEKEEMFDIIKDIPNDVDACIVALLFEGVSTKNQFAELVNLKEKDVDFSNNEIHLGDRVINVSEETMALVRGAIENDKYISVKGEKTRSYKIAESEFVLRGTRGKQQLDQQAICQKILRTVSEAFELPYLNATRISYSGQIHMANELFAEGLSLDEVVPRVMTRFNIEHGHQQFYATRQRIQRFIPNCQ